MSERREKRRRPTPPLTVGWLCGEAVAHLQRWPASERRVRQLLWKRVGRAQSFHGGTKEEAAALVAEAMAKLVAGSLVDDGRFAQLWVVSLRRRGTSGRMIRQKLRDKGVEGHHIEAALEAYEDDEGVDPERASAMAYAKRRRLGCHRHPFDDSRERRSKDLASMGRAGFSYGVAQDVLMGASE
jgi:regulatory protein